jgi:hypothetical protein
MKRASEGQFGAALRDSDVAGIVYKPPDDARTWKPCDYMVWVTTSDPRWDNGTLGPALSIWFEVKDVDAVNAFNFTELRPAQVAGIADAKRAGIPYWLAVYWRRHRSWTISDAAKVMDWRAASSVTTRAPRSVSRELLMSRFGVDATPSTLSSVLKSVLLGDI